MITRILIALLFALGLAVSGVFAAEAPETPESPEAPSQPEEPVEPVDPDEPTEPVEPTEPAEPDTVAGAQDFFATLSANPELAMFAQAFMAAAIDERLADREWTVFALADSVLLATDAALSEPDAITHYIVEGAFTEADLWQLAEESGGMATLTTLGGEEITVETSEDQLRIGGVALISEADIEATGGYVHVIDSMIPMAEEAAGG